MYIIRPILPEDLSSLIEMAEESGIGFTSLPANPEKMKAKIQRAVQSFNDQIDQKDALYLFVMEDTETGELAGVSAIESQIGHQDVWYNYHVGNTVNASAELGVHKQTKTLYLSNDLTGATELCTLFLRESHRGGANGRFLSKQRYLFLANFQSRFNERVIAEMRGVSDDQGMSPFWDGLGKKFFQIEFKEADYLTGLGDKAFIAELMPKYPIYVPFLPEAAQQAIGKVHSKTAPALALLKQEGFRENNYIDIFDAGPTVECRLADIRSVKDSRILSWSEIPASSQKAGSELCMVSNLKFDHYRVILVLEDRIKGKSVKLTAAESAQLKLSVTDQVRAVSLRPKN